MREQIEIVVVMHTLMFMFVAEIIYALYSWGETHHESARKKKPDPDAGLLAEIERGKEDLTHKFANNHERAAFGCWENLDRLQLVSRHPTDTGRTGRSRWQMVSARGHVAGSGRQFWKIWVGTFGETRRYGLQFFRENTKYGLLMKFFNFFAIKNTSFNIFLIKLIKIQQIIEKKNLTELKWFQIIENEFRVKSKP